MTARTTDEHPTIAWMAVLFAVGSACFLLAALVSQWASTPRAAIGITFFAGSICFTAAAYMQHWLAVRNAPTWRAGTDWSLLRPARWPVRHVDVLASLIQPSSGAPLSAHVANGTTALGALGFLIGALLLYPRAGGRHGQAAPAA